MIKEKQPDVSDQVGSRSHKKQQSWAASWVRSIAAALVMWFFLRALVLEAFHITSGSMETTMLVGDVLFVNKAVYGARVPLLGFRTPAFREPKRLDIVIFESVDEPGLTVVKRVIGVSGDTIGMRDNQVYLNGAPLVEPYVVLSGDRTDPVEPTMRLWQSRYYAGDDLASYQPSLKNWGPVVVPPDSVFVMGDNRDRSLDGRYWGFLGRARIRGRAAVIYYSFDRNGILPLPFITGIRWSRLFTRIR